jgi:alkanesulfonate monooxygenase SsuD/methylene tetrahydromethanopterin reductase-like flavin-dependent oxidoreductase (luciferase family)
VERRLGFGVAGALQSEVIMSLAKAAEELGYSTFWVNDTPGGDGIVALSAAAATTESIRLGVGVIPVDRRPPEAIAEAVQRLGIPLDRLVLGVGSGATRLGSLSLVEGAINQLRELVSDAKIAVGALGPKMVELGARDADAILLNWLTPEQAASSAAVIRSEADELDRVVEVIGYVRTALPSAQDRLANEAQRYAAIPQYGDHFDRMGVDALETCAIGHERELNEQLEAFEVTLDETVVRAIVGEEAIEDYLELMAAVAPGNS